MKKDIAEFVARYLTYQQVKAEHQKPAGGGSSRGGGDGEGGGGDGGRGGDGGGGRGGGGGGGGSGSGGGGGGGGGGVSGGGGGGGGGDGVVVVVAKELQIVVSELRSKALKLAKAEMSFYSQLAKAKFLKNSDKGIKFFHNLIKSRRVKSSIPSITLENGTRSTSNEQVSDAFVQYYMRLLSSKGECMKLNPKIVYKGKSLDSDQAITLTHPVTEEEIKSALLSIGDNKAPRPNGINDTDLDVIKGITGFTQRLFLFRYLGIPVVDSRLTIAHSHLIDKILESIGAWAGGTLSYTGRTELIKSMLQGVECFWLSILPIPARVKAKIVQLCMSFLWNGKYTMNKSPLVAWKDVTLLKAEGDLGIWKDTLWVQWVHQIYMKRGCFWEYKNKHEDSPY
ncbi:hypothetical protein Acr_05g0007540 [Actinidia rufa]|uniref:Uncharacterized protein n=1 Tax=Actinidia rufa TaxID=165716 RepID=A0A7J0EKX5_9ERIC|nr:hypothetical protein Acr_05g0007540 [Actinidia rufa]